MITEEFAPYELALELKQLGFDEPCLASYYHAGRIGENASPAPVELALK